MVDGALCAKLLTLYVGLAAVIVDYGNKVITNVPLLIGTTGVSVY